MKNTQLQVSICIPAYNEEKNIGLILQALIEQQTEQVFINKIVVVSSGSTDRTDSITLEYQAKDPRVRLIREKSRNGKAAAINAFLKVIDDAVVVIESADTIPRPNTIELLCTPFIKNQEIGMTGGAPFPVNDPNTFTGYVVHTWWWFHRHIPRFGEIIAYRNLFPEISAKTAVDEAFIQAKIIQLGLKAVHIDEAIVQNKGPETVADLLKQRRRIFNGHSRLFHEEGVKIDNMTKSSLTLLREYNPGSFKKSIWFMGGIGIEVLARLLGTYDAKVKKINPFVWDTAKSTKHLSKSVKADEYFQEREKSFLSQEKGQILFMNFAPLSFGGGVEKWIASVANSIVPTNKVFVIDVDKSISDKYAQLVLKRKFDQRVQPPIHDNLTTTSITWKTLIPFTEKGKEVRNQIQDVKYIYTKLEVNEIVLILYFGGTAALKKTIIGLHSPFFYNHIQLTFFEKLHNVIYTSFIVKYFLATAHQIHVLNPDQKKKLTDDFGLKNVTLIPNFIDANDNINLVTKKNTLKVCFVGELSMRKGADVLMQVLEKNSTHLTFDIIGDGPMKNNFINLPYKNVNYRGFLPQNNVNSIIRECDVLLMPSRAESFSLASLEALSNGLVVICSSDISPNTLEKYLIINQSNTVKEYLQILENLYHQKIAGSLAKKRLQVAEEVRHEFSKKKLLSRLHHELFHLKISYGT